MKIMDWIEDLMTRRSRARHELIIATRQGTAAVALVRLTWGSVVLYEVYNSDHCGQAPMMWETFREALGYTFPRRLMDDEQRHLRQLARQNYLRITEPERYEDAALISHRTDAPKVDLEQLAIERLAGLGTERGAALAMEIERGRQRREGLQ